MENRGFRFVVLIVQVFVVSMLLGCVPSADERYDAGVSDGYAEGYNTECKIRATLVDGDWSDENYLQGYQEGRAAGVADCKAGK